MIEYRPVFLATFIFVGITLLQTTLLDFIAVRGIIPDLALILLVFLIMLRMSMQNTWQMHDRLLLPGPESLQTEQSKLLQKKQIELL